MSHPNSGIAVIGIDIGKNSFHLVGQDRRGAIVLRQKWSRGQVEASHDTSRPISRNARPASPVPQPRSISEAWIAA